VCRLRRLWFGRRRARSAQAAPASTLARVTVWREAARVLLQAVAASLSLRSLSAGCSGFYAGARHGVARGSTCAASGVAAWLSPRSLSEGCSGFYAGARHGVARGGTCAASGSGGLAVAALARRGLRGLLRCGARHGVWREVARVLPQAAAAWPLLRSLGAGCAGFYAGARHGVAQGGMCAASGGSGLAVVALAQRKLRRLPRWRASRCGARLHVCRLRRRRLGRRCACSTRAAPAHGLARVTVWRVAAHMLAQAAAAWPSLRSLDAGSASS